MKLDRKQDLNVLYQVCVFRADRKNKMAALASDWLRHFRLLLWNHWTEFNETWQEARSQHPLPSSCFLGRSKKQEGRPGLWLAETFSTSPLKPLNGIQRNLSGSKISTSSTKFVFFGLIGKTRWPPWPLIGWDIFDFFSETAERNSKKLDRKQDLNVLYQVRVFRADRKIKMAALASDWLRHFGLLLWTAERNSTKLDRKQDLNVLYQVCIFRADRKNKMAALASDWLGHFRLLLWNHWTEFKETWQEARSQRLLPSFFFRLMSKQKFLSWLICQKGGTLYSGARYVALWASCCFTCATIIYMVSLPKVTQYFDEKKLMNLSTKRLEKLWLESFPTKSLTGFEIWKQQLLGTLSIVWRPVFVGVLTSPSSVFSWILPWEVSSWSDVADLPPELSVGSE